MPLPTVPRILERVCADLAVYYLFGQARSPARGAHRADFEDYLSHPGLTEIQRVARWYMRNSISFGDGFSAVGVKKSTPPSRRYIAAATVLLIRWISFSVSLFVIFI